MKMGTVEMVVRHEVHRERSAPEGTERRVLPMADIELRVVDDEDGRPSKIEGYAAVYNRDSLDLGGFIERIRPGAFTNALSESDVRALVNHDSNLLLGRTASGTLHLTETKRGLKFSVDLADTQAARDAATNIKRGDMDGSSFAFSVEEDAWSIKDGKDFREIVEFKRIFDVGPVTYPAYPDTTVAARSLDAWREQRDTEIDGADHEDADDTPDADAEAAAAVEGETPDVNAAGDTTPDLTPAQARQKRMDDLKGADKKLDREMLERDIARKMTKTE